MSGSGRLRDLSCLSGMTKKFVMRVKEETLFPFAHNKEAQTFLMLGCALQSIDSLFPAQHYKFPDPDIFAVDIALHNTVVEPS
ncbi:unnamed protein product, partial [Amoebophrya sp. A120]|eukprot:GSA120T00016042001.1